MWARLVFGGTGHRWHIVRGAWAICGRQNFDYPRVERSAAPTGKLCKHCLATAMNNATPEEIARAMEGLPTDALEWAVRFEALAQEKRNAG